MNGWGRPRLTLLFLASFVLALIPRCVGLNGLITSDEPYWMQRSLRFGAALAQGDFDQTFRSGHPGVTVMWLGALAVGPRGLTPFLTGPFPDFRTLATSPGFLDALNAARVAIALATAGLTALNVLLACRLLGAGAGLVGGGLLLLDPYLVGMSQVLHVDALLAPLMTASALSALLYWVGERDRRDLLLSAAAGGLALLTKAPALHAALFFGFVGLVSSRRDPSGLLVIPAWGLIAGGTYFALWPAMWVNPLGRLGDVVHFVQSVGGEPHIWSSFFLGQVLRADPGPLFYPVALAYRLSPVTLFGLATLFLRPWRRHGFGPLIWLGLNAILFVGLMSLGAKKLDRYMLPAIMVIQLLAGAALWWAIGLLRSARWIAVAAATVVVAQGAVLWHAQPYPLAFYSPLFGGAAGAQRALLIGWGEGLERVASYLNAQPDAADLAVGTLYAAAFRPMFHGTTLRLYEHQPIDYLLVYVNMAQRGLIPRADRHIVAEQAPELTVAIDGVEYARIYRVTGVPQGLEEGPPEDEGDKD